MHNLQSDCEFHWELLVFHSVPKPLVNRGTLHMPIRGHSFWKHSCLRGQTHVAWICVCDSPDSQETWFSCHTAPDCYTACAVCLTITRIPPTETSEDATDSSAALDQQMWKAFLYLLTYFYPFKGWHSGGFQASITWPESPERTYAMICVNHIIKVCENVFSKCLDVCNTKIRWKFNWIKTYCWQKIII